jgi:hypothetical protein
MQGPDERNLDMLTILLVFLFILLTLACLVLLHQSLAEDGPGDARHRPPVAKRPRDPFAPILQAGSETDDITTVKMLGRVP